MQRRCQPFFAIYNNKGPEFPGAHFRTLHSLCGLLAAVFALAAALWAECRGLRSRKFTVWVDRRHRQLGYTAVVLGHLAVLTGVYNKIPLVDWKGPSLAESVSVAPSGWALANFGSAAHAAWSALALAALVLAARPRARASKEA